MSSQSIMVFLMIICLGSLTATRGAGSGGGWTDRGVLPPHGPSPIASALGDTDGEFFGRKFFRPKNFSTENFAVRIAEGGCNGGESGGGQEPPPVRPSVGPSGSKVPSGVNYFEVPLSPKVKSQDGLRGK